MPRGKPAVTEEQMKNFLATLAICGNVTKACDVAGIARMTAYRYKKTDDKFAELWEEAAKVGAQGVLDEVRRRAYSGWDEPVFYQGEVLESVRKYSDTLLIFLTKVVFPELRDNRLRTEHSGEVAVTHGLDLSKLPPDKLRELHAILKACEVDPEE